MAGGRESLVGGDPLVGGDLLARGKLGKDLLVRGKLGREVERGEVGARVQLAGQTERRQSPCW